MPGAHDARDPRSVEVLRTRHLLLLDEETVPSDVVALVHNRIPDLPAPEVVSAGEMLPEGVLTEDVKSWRLTRHSRLEGPFLFDAATCAELGIPARYSRAFALVAPRDREPSPPPSWYRDPDGLHLLFPGGLPSQEEGRQIDLLIAVARRLHGGVRFSDEQVDPQALLSPSGVAAAAEAEANQPAGLLFPDPDAHIDLFVYGSYWLAPEVLFERLRALDSTVEFPVLPEGAGEDGARDDGAAGHGGLELDGYSILVPLTALGERAGSIEIRVMEEEALPRIVRMADPESPTRVLYHLHWMDADQQRYLPEPDEELRRLRLAASVRLDRLAGEVLRATGGTVLDEDGFLVAPAQLG
ncbi:hypothetical protein [Brevibacterium samyangense]|uniref:Suppressor of fused protein (SUFU) n=1 Tax=Brevibacterium samyangense TaxID=366888 RepID=A0ABN2TAX9_9MICO